MNSLPKELLQIIFSYLSQKYLARCSLVCKTWYEATRLSKYYSTIKLTNYKQLINFIEMANTSKINDIPVGQFVRYLYLKVLPKSVPNITITDLQALHKACPNLESFNILNKLHIKTDKKSAFPFWEKLTHIDCWMASYLDSWILKQELLLRQNQQPVNPIVSIAFNIHAFIKKVIIMEFKHRFSFYNDDINKNENIYENVDFHTLYLSFTSTWHHLTSLSIDFEPDYYIDQDYFILTDHSFESIQQTCPSLESLAMAGIDLSITNDYINFHHLITPCTSLTSLSFIGCMISNSHIFNYISKKYPQLSKIKFHFHIDTETDEFAIHLNDMFNQLSHMNHLSIDFAEHPDFPGQIFPFEPDDGLFLHYEFKQWLLEHPYQLQSLEYPYSLISPSVLNCQLYESDNDNEEDESKDDESDHDSQGDESDNDSQNNQSYCDSEDYSSYKESDNDSEDKQSHNDSVSEEKNDQIVILPINQQQQQQLLLLDDLFYENGYKIPAAYTLTSIALDSINCDKLHCSITHFLNTFPNLKKIEISFANIYDFDVKNERVEELSPFLIYPLEKLTFLHVNMSLNAGLSKLFNHCPKLKTIDWSFVSFYIKYKRTISDYFGKRGFKII